MAIVKKISPFKSGTTGWGSLSNMQKGGIASAGFSALGVGISGHLQNKQRQSDLDAAKAQQEIEMNAFRNLDTSNAYAGYENQYSENVFEDLTVNQQQSQFLAQQQQQNTANTMSQYSSAAGNSGIAALAQAMANQNQKANQQNSASIGAQESQNQKLAAQGALQVQKGEDKAQLTRLQGASESRLLEYQKSQGLLAYSTGQVVADQQAISQASQNRVDMFGNIISAGSQAYVASQV